MTSLVTDQNKVTEETRSGRDVRSTHDMGVDIMNLVDIETGHDSATTYYCVLQSLDKDSFPVNLRMVSKFVIRVFIPVSENLVQVVNSPNSLQDQR